jgi:hypothetical protein
MLRTGTTFTARIYQNRYMGETSMLQDSIYMDLAHLNYCLNKITIDHVTINRGEGSSESLRITSGLSAHVFSLLSYLSAFLSSLRVGNEIYLM